MTNEIFSDTKVIFTFAVELADMIRHRSDRDRRTQLERGARSENDPIRTSEAKSAMRVTVNPSYDASPINR